MRYPLFLSLLAAFLAWPASAAAHGLTGRADLPIPTWLFSWAAALVLVISFVAMAAMWPRPRLEDDGFRPLPASLSRPLTSTVVDVACGAIGVGLFALVLWAGFFGTDSIPSNIAPAFVYVAFWLGLTLLSVLFGDVFRAFNPWRAVGRLAGFAIGRNAPEPLAYPRGLGRWPAAAALVGFVWLEVGSSSGDEPSVVALAVCIYSAVTWIAMAVYGVDAWTRYAEGFSVYFNLFSRLAPLERRGREIGVRRFLTGLSRLELVPGTVAVIAVMIGTVTFDGLSAGPTWQEFLQPAIDVLRDLGLGPQAALEWTYVASLFVVIGLVYGFYRLGVAGAASVQGSRPASELEARFAHSLVPIALAYCAAHYVSLLVFGGQSLAALASDPGGLGWNLLGTATWGVDYGVISAELFWYAQLAFVIAGHVAALTLAHDRALVLYDDPRLAARSQYWMLTVMVGFTVLALWLLSEASKG